MYWLPMLIIFYLYRLLSSSVFSLCLSSFSSKSYQVLTLLLRGCYYRYFCMKARILYCNWYFNCLFFSSSAFLFSISSSAYLQYLDLDLLSLETMHSVLLIWCHFSSLSLFMRSNSERQVFSCSSRPITYTVSCFYLILSSIIRCFFQLYSLYNALYFYYNQRYSFLYLFSCLDRFDGWKAFHFYLYLYLYYWYFRRLFSAYLLFFSAVSQIAFIYCFICYCFYFQICSQNCLVFCWSLLSNSMYYFLRCLRLTLPLIEALDFDRNQFALSSFQIVLLVFILDYGDQALLMPFIPSVLLLWLYLHK